MRFPSSVKSFLAGSLCLTLSLAHIPVGQAAVYDISGIPEKNTGDAISAAELNLIVDMLNNLKKDDRDDADVTNDRFGIGLAGTPGYELDVNGTVNATAFRGDGSQLTNLPNPGFWQGTASDIYYNAGKVAIGINSSPVYQLEVHNVAGTSGIEVDGSGANDALLQLTNGSQSWRVVNNGSSTNNFQIVNVTDGNNVTMAINAANNNTAFSDTVNVGGNVEALQYCDENGANCFTAAGVSGGGLGSSKWEDGTGEADEIYYSAGNIGIGVSNPAYALDVVGNTQFNDHVSVGPTADPQADTTLEIRENYSDDTNRYLMRIRSNASGAPTGNKTQYGVYIDNSTSQVESGGNVYSRGIYSRTRSNGSATFNSLFGINGIAYNDSDAGTGVGTLYGVVGEAYNQDTAATVGAAYGGNFHARGRSGAPAGNVNNLYGTYNQASAYDSGVTNAYGAYNYARTVNGDAGDISTAYGSYNFVNVDSAADGNITTGYAGYFRTAGQTGSNLMTSATGVYSDVNNAVTAYGGRFYADDTNATTNYGIVVGASGGTNNYGIYGTDGDWILDADGDGTVGGTGSDLIIGEDADLRIYHDGTDSVIDNRTGDLVLLNSGSGNVGIGTTSPSYPLVVSNSGAEGLEVIPGVSSGVTVLQTYNRSGSSYDRFVIDGADFQFRPAGSTNIPNQVFFSSTGDVMIGDATADGTLKLDVEGPIGATEYCDADGNNCTSAADIATGAAGKWQDGVPANSIYYSAGNVGIGTNSPALQSAGTGLHVNGASNAEIKFTNTTTGVTASDGTALVLNGNNFVLNNREAGSMSFGTNNATAMTINSSGLVGVGLAAPSEELHLRNDQADATTLAIQNESNGSSATVRSGVVLNTDGAQFDIIQYGTGATGLTGDQTRADAAFIRTTSGAPASKMVIGTGSASPLHFVTGDATRMTVNGAGNVGIGTLSPGALLEVSKDAADLIARIDGDVGRIDFAMGNAIGQSPQMRFSDQGGDVAWTIGANDYNDNAFIIAPGSTGSPIDIEQAQALGAYTNAFGFYPTGQFYASGDVGFGTDSPAEELHVLKSQAAPTTIVAGNTSTSTNTNTRAGLTAAANGGQIDVYHAGSNAGGSVGDQTKADAAVIRTTSGAPSSKLIIGNGGAVPVNFITGDVTRMTITGTGSVGVGDQTPDGTLLMDVEGRVGATEYCDADGNNCTAAGALGSGYWSKTGDDVYYNPGATGEVGIGLSNPSEELVVNRASTNPTTVAVQNSSTGSGNNVEAGFTAQSNSAAVRMNVYGSNATGTIGGQNRADSAFVRTSSGLPATSLNVGTGTANPLNFFTNDVTRMTISSTGNVGVGTTAPGRPFSLASATYSAPLQIQSDVATGTLAQFVSGASVQGYIGYINSGTGGMGFLNNAGSLNANLLVTNAGNVGIGTTSPVEKLSIEGSVANIRLTDTDTGADSAIASNSGVGGLQLMADVNNEVAGSYVALNVDGGAEELRVTESGNVGIGTTSPAYKMTVHREATVGTTSAALSGINPLLYLDGGNELDSSIVIKKHNTADNAAIGSIKFASSPDGLNYSWAGITALQDQNAAADALVFYISNSNTSGVTSTEVMRIDEGDVGIGDSTPDGTLKLDVAGQIGATEYCDENGNNCTAAAALGSGYWSKTGDDVWYSPGATGEVGIGLSNPTEELVVNRSANNAPTTIAVQNSNTGTGTNTRAGFTASSNGAQLDAMVYSSGATGTIGGVNKADGAFIRTGTTLAPSSLNIGTGGAQDVNIFTNDTTRLTVDGSTGNVGIGTAPNGNKFSIVTTGMDGLDVVTGGTSNFNTTFFARSTGAPNAFIVRGGGQVGVGTITPSEELHVLNNQANPTTIVAGNTSTSTNTNTRAGFTAAANGGQLDIYHAGSAATGNVADQTKADAAVIRTTSAAPSSKLVVGTGSAAPVNFITNDVTRMTIDSDGDVGIGETAPTHKLEVSGGDIDINQNNLYLRDEPTSGNGSYFGVGYNSYGGTGLTLFSDTDISFTESDSNTEVLRVDVNNKQVGIGGDPIEAFHIQDTAANILLTDTDTGADFAIATNSGVGGALIGADIGNEVANSYLGFAVDGNELVRLTSGGAVGIGTNSPDVLLEVAGGGDTNLHVHSTDNVSALAVSDNLGSVKISTLNGVMDFYTGGTASTAGTGTSFAMRIDATGDVGVGDSSPDGTLKLDVEGRVGATEYCDENGNNCTAAAALGSGYWSKTGDDVWYNPGATGEVGIGLSNPTEELVVNRSANNAPTTIAVQNSNTGTGTNTRAGFTASSNGAQLDAMVYSSGATGTIGGVNKADGAFIRTGTTLAPSSLNIGTGGAQNLNFFTNDVTRMSVRSNGNVGIGIASPTEALHVYGATDNVIQSQTTGANNWASFRAVTPSRAVAFGNNDSADVYGLYDVTGASWRLAIPYATGNVGIGTAGPAEELTVTNAQANPTTIYVNNSSTSTNTNTRAGFAAAANGGQLDIYHASSGATGTIAGINKADAAVIRTLSGSPSSSMIIGNGGNSPLHLITNDTPRLTIRNDGNVGIGETNPLANLHISDAGSQATIRVSNSVAGNSIFRSWSDGGTAKTIIASGLNDNIITYHNQNGNVGMGTQSPSQRLHLSGADTTLAMTDTDTGADFAIATNSGVGGALIGADVGNEVANSYLGLAVDGTERVRVTATGSVGMGDTTPDGTLKLDVEGQVGATSYCDNSGNNCISAVELALGGDYNSAAVTAGNWYRIASNSGDRAHARFQLRDTISGGGHSTLVFEAGTNFNSSNGMSFTVLAHSMYNTATFTKARILQNTTYDSQYLEVYAARSGSVSYTMFDNNQSSGWTAVDWTAGAVPGGYTVHEYDTDNVFMVGASDDAFTVARNMNVGIGATAPAEQLHIQDTAANIQLTDTDTGADAYILTNSGVGGMILAADYNNEVAGSYMAFNTDGTERFRIDADGEIGIGTTTPGATLDVNGTVRATSFVQSSDERLKENIATIADPLAVIGLRGVTFNWKEDGKADYGFIAQEVETLYPELVYTDADNGMKAVDYSSMTAILLEAIKEQQHQIETLNQRISQLETKQQ